MSGFQSDTPHNPMPGFTPPQIDFASIFEGIDLNIDTEPTFIEGLTKIWEKYQERQKPWQTVRAYRALFAQTLIVNLLVKNRPFWQRVIAHMIANEIRCYVLEPEAYVRTMKEIYGRTKEDDNGVGLRTSRATH